MHKLGACLIMIQKIKGTPVSVAENSKRKTAMISNYQDCRSLT